MRPVRGSLLLLLLMMSACVNPREARIREDTDQYIIGVQYEDTRGLVKRTGPFRAEIGSHPQEEWTSIRDRYEQVATAAATIPMLREFPDRGRHGTTQGA